MRSLSGSEERRELSIAEGRTEVRSEAVSTVYEPSFTPVVEPRTTTYLCVHPLSVGSRGADGAQYDEDEWE